MAQADDGGERVRGVHPLHRLEHGVEAVVVAGGQDREGDIHRRDRRTVVKQRVGRQMDGQRVAPGREGPAPGQVGLRLAGGVEPEQAREQLRAGDGRRGYGGEDRVQRRRPVQQRDPQQCGVAAGGTCRGGVADRIGSGGRSGLGRGRRCARRGDIRPARGLGARCAGPGQSGEQQRGELGLPRGRPMRAPHPSPALLAPLPMQWAHGPGLRVGDDA